MLGILLKILQIIGIIFLSILALLILLVLLALFVPVRYKIEGENGKDGLKFTVRLHYLLHLVRGRYDYPEPAEFKMKALWFTVYPHEDRQDKKRTKKDSASKNAEPQKAELQKAEPESEEPEKAEPKERKAEDRKKVQSDKQLPQPQKHKCKKKKKTFGEKIIYTWKHICDKIKHIVDGIKKFFLNIRHYIEILQMEETKAALALCMGEVKRLLKAICPRKIMLDARVGLGSPDKTGYLCGVIGILYPYFGKHIYIVPDFEEFIFEGTFCLKGRLRMATVLRVAWRVYKDKNIRLLLQQFKMEDE